MPPLLDLGASEAVATLPEVVVSSTFSSFLNFFLPPSSSLPKRPATTSPRVTLSYGLALLAKLPSPLPSSVFLDLTFSGKPLCLVLAKSSASFFFMPLAVLATSLLAGFSPFCAECTMPIKRCCFLLTAFS